MTDVKIGVVGGSGLYEMDGLTDVSEEWIETPFGKPSDAFLVGTLEGQRVAFLPRHGRGHRISPTEVNYRANIWAFKSLGVKYLIAVNACGSLREDWAPRHIVIPDQLVDRTRNRAASFFEGGVVAHISVADPFEEGMCALLEEAVSEAGATVHRGGRFVIVEGPRFSTRAESHIYRSWGCDIIGMTTVPEAFLAREAEIAFAAMAHVTDFDVWHETEEEVSVGALIETLNANVEVAREAVRGAVRRLSAGPSYASHQALGTAIISSRKRSAVPPETWGKLELLVAPYFEDEEGVQ